MLSASEKMQARSEFADRMMNLIGPAVFEPEEVWRDVQRDFMAGKLIICRRLFAEDQTVKGWVIES